MSKVKADMSDLVENKSNQYLKQLEDSTKWKTIESCASYAIELKKV